MPLELLGSFLEAIGFARMVPDEPIREDELEVVPLLQLGLSSGFLDQLWSTRLGRAYAEGLRLIARVEKEVWQARFIAPLLASGADQQTARDRASQLSADLNPAPVIDRALLAAYRRQQELSWIEQLVEDIEAALAVLRMVEQLPEAGLPPAHVGVAAGPVVVQGGDYFGRTVNLAARIASRAGAGQVLVSESVLQAPPPDGVRFVELGEVQLKGFARPVRLLEVCRA